MPTFRSLVLHLAIAAGATLMVAAAAVAVGLSGAHSIGGQLETSDAVRVAGDWPDEMLRSTRGSVLTLSTGAAPRSIGPQAAHR